VATPHAPSFVVGCGSGAAFNEHRAAGAQLGSFSTFGFVLGQPEFAGAGVAAMRTLTASSDGDKGAQ
jgi:hypothetical protein